MNQLGIKLDTENSNLKIQKIQENPDVIELKRKFTKLFHENKTVKEIELKPDTTEGPTDSDTFTTSSR